MQMSPEERVGSFGRGGPPALPTQAGLSLQTAGEGSCDRVGGQRGAPVSGGELEPQSRCDCEGMRIHRGQGRWPRGRCWPWSCTDVVPGPTLPALVRLPCTGAEPGNVKHCFIFTGAHDAGVRGRGKEAHGRETACLSQKYPAAVGAPGPTCPLVPRTPSSPSFERVALPGTPPTPQPPLSRLAAQTPGEDTVSLDDLAARGF